MAQAKVKKAPKSAKSKPQASKLTKKAVKKSTKPTQAKPKSTTEPSAEKQEIISKFQVKQGDTGSPEVQAALLSSRIGKLVSHLKENPSDNHSRRGLLGIVSKRRRLLNYLEKKDQSRYKDLTVKLGLAK